MIKEIDIDTKCLEGYSGKTLYHKGLIYEPTEDVLILATKYLGTFPGAGTCKRNAKLLARFCRYFITKVQDKQGIPNIITRFERYVTRDHVDRWMSQRVIERLDNESPKDKTIEDEAMVILRYLNWAKEYLKDRGENIPFEGGREVTKVISLKETHMFKGIQGPINKNVVQFNANVQYKPAPGTRPKVLAQRFQTKGHEYLRDDEIHTFVNSFYDDLWKWVSLTAYHTGMRPSEVLGLPWYKQYDHENAFTADPVQIRELMNKGKTEMIYECLGKGRKERQVKFVLKDWLVIMEGYAPIFNERRKKFRKAYGKDLPLHNLWLARKWKSKGPRIIYCLPGDEGNYDTYCSPLYTAVDTARKGNSKKPNLEELFGHGVDFYSLRHSFATNFLINALKADEDLTRAGIKDPNNLIKDINLRQMLMNQMGHDLWDTTWNSYIHNTVARLNLPLPSVTEILDYAM